ncbi:MAG: bifunctional nuclease family protein [Gemmataceae bacterium]
MPIAMALRRIIICEVDDQQIIELTEINGERSLPIVVGLFEATSIQRRVKSEKMPPRPLTHDLICAVIDDLGGELQDILINDLNDGTYYAKLRVRRDGELIAIDCRPSDAIAVAVTCKVPMYVAEEVLGDSVEL